MVASLLQRYYDYRCSLLVFGYARIKINKIMLNDICNICINYIHFPDATTTHPDINIPDKIEYLLLTDFLQSFEVSYTIQNSLYAQKICWEKWKSLHLHNYIPTVSFHGLQWMKDKELFKSLSLCINWACCIRGVHFWVGTDHDIVQKYLDIVINLSKKALQIKYPLISELITMYECYYFDLYVFKFIKQKLGDIKASIFIKKLQVMITKFLKHNFSVDFKVDFEQWTNSNSMQMSSLLQLTTMEYKDNITNILIELNNITEIVQIRYKMIQNLFSRKNHEQIHSQWDDDADPHNIENLYIVLISVCLMLMEQEIDSYTRRDIMTQNMQHKIWNYIGWLIKNTQLLNYNLLSKQEKKT